jgi:glutathione S-transferase
LQFFDSTNHPKGDFHMSNTPIALYYGSGACSMGPHIALNEIGVPYEARRVNLAEKANQKPEYLAVNPKGRVPALQIDGFVLTEAAAILSYLGRRFPEAKLYPQGGEAEARMLEWMAWCSNTVHPSFAHIRRTERYSEDPATYASIQQRGEATFWECLNTIDAALKGKDYALGETYSLADPYFLVFFGWGNSLKKVDMAQKFPSYAAFARRMLERPAVKKVVEMEGTHERFTF